jgi:hypothetical protein
LQFTAKDTAPQLFDASIEMVPDVAHGLPPLLRDFRQRVALKEVEPKRLALIFCQAVQHLAKFGPANQSLKRSIIFHDH